MSKIASKRLPLRFHRKGWEWDSVSIILVVIFIVIAVIAIGVIGPKMYRAIDLCSSIGWGCG